MPKKFGLNEKKQEALEKKEKTKKEKIEKEIEKMENDYWKEDDEKVLKKLNRQKEKEQKRIETLQHKKELKELVEKEEEELQKELNKNKNIKKQEHKITMGSVQQAKEEELKKLSEKFDKQEITTSYDKELNVNVEEDFVNSNFLKMEEYKEYLKNGVDLVEASGVESATESFNINSSITHPEKRVRAAWNAYVDKNLPDLKKQFPKYRRNKLLDILSKDFNKSTDNPMVIYKLQKQKELVRQQLLEESRMKDKKDGKIDSDDD